MSRMYRDVHGEFILPGAVSQVTRTCKLLRLSDGFHGIHVAPSVHVPALHVPCHLGDVQFQPPTAGTTYANATNGGAGMAVA